VILAQITAVLVCLVMALLHHQQEIAAKIMVT
jgi:hypothetical protein